MDTEQTFDQEFTVEEITKAIVDQAKSDIKAKYGNKKRHRQWLGLPVWTVMGLMLLR